MQAKLWNVRTRHLFQPPHTTENYLSSFFSFRFFYFKFTPSLSLLACFPSCSFKSAPPPKLSLAKDVQQKYGNTRIFLNSFCGCIISWGTPCYRIDILLHNSYKYYLGQILVLKECMSWSMYRRYNIVGNLSGSKQSQVISFH